jgi:hypothetical protein
MIDMPKISCKVLPLSEKMNVLNFIRYKEKLNAGVAEIYSIRMKHSTVTCSLKIFQEMLDDFIVQSS